MPAYMRDHHRNRRWRASVQRDHTYRSLGYFTTFEEAKAAEDEYLGLGPGPASSASLVLAPVAMAPVVMAPMPPSGPLPPAGVLVPSVLPAARHYGQGVVAALPVVGIRAPAAASAAPTGQSAKGT